MTEPTMNPSPPAGVSGVNVRVAMKSDVGRVRTENQDFAVVTTPDEYRADKGQLMLVADGMGGHRGGATASRMAAEIIKSEYMDSTDGDVEAVLRRALQKANAQIYQDSQTNPELRGMGTTCSVVVIRGDAAHVAHVGDSRVYLIRDNTIEQLTEDHSLVATMVKEGLLTTREAEVHPRRNVLQRSVGVLPELEADFLPPMKIKPGDIFVICSDGLHGLVKPEEILEVARQPLEQAVDDLVNRALSRGAPDNVTVVVVRVEEP